MNPALLDLVVCPITRSKLRLEGDFLISSTGNIQYPIKDGIPVLIAEQAILPEGTTLSDLKAKYAQKK